MKGFLIKWMKNPYVFSLLLAMVIVCALIYGTLKWLDVYTRHNEAVVVPDVKGLNMEEATEFFENNNLRYNVIDSVFSKDVKPGAIVELVPAAGSKVKEGRIVRCGMHEQLSVTEGVYKNMWDAYTSAYHWTLNKN